MRRRAAAATAALAVGAAVAAVTLCVTRVPQGRVGLLRADGAGRVLQPGLHLNAPLSRPLVVNAGPRAYAGDVTVTTPEGATLVVPFRAVLDLTRAESIPLAGLLGRIRSEDEVGSGLAAIIQECTSNPTGGDAWQRVAGSRLSGLGLADGGLVFGPARAGGRRENPLRATYQPPEWNLLVIGVDSADWDLMTPLMESGALPHLRALRDRGAWAALRSMTPTLSPLLWTTIATGKPPEDHGIMDFLQRDPETGQEVPISRLFRRVKGLWNIAGDFGLTSLTVGWWATWPAERVNGWMVSDRVAYSLFDVHLGGQAAGMVHPPSLLERLPDLMMSEDAITYDDLRGLVDVPREEFDRARRLLDTAEGYRDPVSHLIKVLASTLSYHRIARDVIERDHPAMSLVYFEGLDEVNHRFAHYLPPAMAHAPPVGPELRRAFGEAVPNFYRLQDRLVGELVAAAGPGAVVVVLSDHGFANGEERPADVPPDVEGKPGRWHTLDGALIVSGPPIARGRVGRSVDLIDIAPTVLALLRLPAAADMPGRIVTDLFVGGAPPPAAVVSIASYEEVGEPLEGGPGGLAATSDPEVIEKLQALGYIQSGSAVSASSGTPIYHMNAGRIFLEKRDLERAAAEFRKARVIAPRFDEPLLGLAQVEVMRGRPADALPLLEEALQVAAAPPPVLLTQTAKIYARAGAQSRGLEVLEASGYDGLREAYRLTAVGMLREDLGDAGGAVKAYRQALELDGGVDRALYGLYTLLTRSRQLDDLATLLEKGARSQTVRVSVRSANWLALTRERQGLRAEAERILEEARSRRPDDPMTLTNLGSLLVDQGRAEEGLPHLERAYTSRPKSFEILVNLILGHGKLGRLEEARRIYREAEALAGPAELRHLYNAFALACFVGGRSDEALGYLDRSLALDPSQEGARRLKSEISRTGG